MMGAAAELSGYPGLLEKWRAMLAAAPATLDEAPGEQGSAKLADLKRQLDAEREHGKRLQQQLDAILRTLP
jgi:hypothetical protein